MSVPITLPGIDRRAVFPFEPSRRSFARCEAFTRLAQDWCGFFKVETATQTLVTRTKSGCCWHLTTRWKVVNNVPREIFRHTIEHKPSGREDEWLVVETKARRLGDRWSKTTTRRIERLHP